jgi:hypothetical protein
MSKRLLELFCGTKSVGKEFQKVGYEVVSLDYNKKFNATHTVDILTWDYKQYEPDYFDVIWASPDCTTFSIATGGKYRTKDMIYGKNNKYQEGTTLGNNMILRLIEILKYFKCNSWFIENPRGLLQHFPPLKEFIKEVNANMNLVYYGNYNWGFPKPTNIWSNLALWENEKMPVIPEDKYEMKYHSKNGRLKRYYYDYYDNNAEERSKIPADLINKLMGLIKN